MRVLVLNLNTSAMTSIWHYEHTNCMASISDSEVFVD